MHIPTHYSHLAGCNLLDYCLVFVSLASAGHEHEMSEEKDSVDRSTCCRYLCTPVLQLRCRWERADTSLWCTRRKLFLVHPLLQFSILTLVLIVQGVLLAMGVSPRGEPSLNME